MLDRLHEGVNGVCQVIAMRDHLGGIESQQLFVVRIHGCRSTGWHLNRGIVRLRYQEIVITTEFLRQRCPHFLPLLRDHLPRVEIYVIVILAGTAVVAATGRNDRRPFEQQGRVPLFRANFRRARLFWNYFRSSRGQDIYEIDIARITGNFYK